MKQIFVSLLACGMFVSANAQNRVGQSHHGTLHRVGTVSPYMGLDGASISPDGHYLTYTDWTSGDLAIYDMITGGHRRITNKGPLRKVLEFAETFMQFSADGKQLAYVWDKNGYELRVINLNGSGSRFIYRNPPGQGEMMAYDWSADGRYVAAVLPNVKWSTTNRTLQISLIRISDASVRGLKDLQPGMLPGSIRFSPDGRFLAYDLGKNNLQKEDIFILRLDNGMEIPAITHPASDRLLDWDPKGSGLLFLSDRGGPTSIWYQKLNGYKPKGVPRLLKDKIPNNIKSLGFTSKGTYYYALSTDAQHEIYTASLDLEKGIIVGLPTQIAQIHGSNEGPDWSTNGKFLAYIHKGSSIVIHSLETSKETILSPKAISNIFTVASGDRYLRWSPDGNTILAPQNRILFLVDVTTGEARPIVTDRRSRYGRWSPDGKSIFFSRQPELNDASLQIVKMNLETQHKEILYNSDLPGDNLSSLEISPDGQWLAFSDVAMEKNSDDEESVLMLLPINGGQPRLLFKVSGSEYLKVVGWTPNSQEILFTRNTKLATKLSTTLWRISINTGTPRSIELGLPVLTNIRFHPDGKRIVFDSGQRGAEIFAMENFLPIGISRGGTQSFKR